MIRAGLAVVAVLVSLHAGLACTNEEARAKVQSMTETLRRKMATKPDQAQDLSDQIGELMGDWLGDAVPGQKAPGASAPDTVCRKVDELAAKAARL